jgi:hypothetical protein
MYQEKQQPFYIFEQIEQILTFVEHCQVYIINQIKNKEQGMDRFFDD